MEAWIRFPIFVAASYALFGAMIYFVLRRRPRIGLWVKAFRLGLLVVVGGMVFAKLGQNQSWPWWIYYPVPAALTVFLPPVYFGMDRREILEYLLMSVLSAPAIHVVFSFLVGWNDYMPFIAIPSLWELIGA